MGTVTVVTALLLGVLACLLAVKVRAARIETLGRDYLLRFLLVQAGIINGLLFLTIYKLSLYQQWVGPGHEWGLPCGYGGLFFLYSLSNIDWTLSKFHTEDA